MTLTQNFKDTVKARVERDRAFKAALFREALDCLMSGDLDTGKTVLRDYINATIGFDGLAAATGTSPKSLMRMFGPKGNPQARNLVEVLDVLQRKTKLKVKIKTAT